MNLSGVALALCIAVAGKETFIDVPGAGDSTISGTIQIVQKQMTIAFCCVPSPEYSLAIGQGTCSAPAAGSLAVIAGRNDWRFSAGHLSAKMPTMFPIRAAGRFHLVFYQQAFQIKPQAMTTLACADVPEELTKP